MAGKPAGRGGKDGAPATIIIRRDDDGADAPHHGGAWKVAYADFVTAMMAFFLLMWLLDATTEAQRTGLADYFAPTNLFGRSVSGSGQPFGGKSPNDDGTSVSSAGMPRVIAGRRTPRQDADADEDEDEVTPATPASGPRAAQDDTDTSSDTIQGTIPGTSPGISRGRDDGHAAAAAARPGPGPRAAPQGGDFPAARLTPPPNPAKPADPENTATEAAAIAADGARENAALAQAAAGMRDAIQRDPALRDVAGQLTIETVPEGLRIQVVDAERRPMFALGGATPTPRAHDLLQKVAPALAALPNAITIAGHTDALGYHGSDKDNWDLSTERANATRRLLLEAGLPDARVRAVTGEADRDLLMPADPFNPANRRITILVLRHAGGTPANFPTPGGTPAISPTPGGTP